MSKKQAKGPAADVGRSSRRIEFPHSCIQVALWLAVYLGDENKLPADGCAIFGSQADVEAVRANEEKLPRHV